MDKIIFPSELAAKALGLNAMGSAAADDSGVCALCGKPVAKGETIEPKPLAKAVNFMNTHDLARRPADFCCRWCSSFLKKAVMGKIIGMVFCAEGAYPILKDVHRAWFFTTPPKPPFSAVVADAKMQHLVWRAPVSYSQEASSVRFGGKILSIRHARLQQSVEAATEAGRLLATWRRESKKTTKKDEEIPHPFLSLDREISNLSHGAIRPDALEASRDVPQLKTLLDFLGGCSAGELWALATLAKRNRPIPEKPEPVTISLEN